MGNPISFEFEVAWGDCDPAGIVFYPCYFRWLDVGSHKLFSAAGVGRHAGVASSGSKGAALVAANCNFRRPVTYGDRLLHRVWISEWRERSFVVAHTFLRGEDVVAEGSETRVLMVQENDGTFRATAIPQAFRVALEAPGTPHSLR